MMCDCPLAFRHKWGSTLVEDFLYLRGDFRTCGACGAIRLYLGASLCIYILLAHDVFLFLIRLFMIGGDTLICICFLFHIAY